MTVAVVGAGLAGLACARALSDSGCDATVFEADQRIGGRVLSVPDPSGTAWEMGAQVIHSGAADVLTRPHALATAAPERTDFAIVLDGRPVRSWQLAARGIRPWEVAAQLPVDGPGSAGKWLTEAGPGGAAGRCARAWIEQDWATAVDTLDTCQAARWNADRSIPGGADLTLPAGLGAVVDRLASGLTIHRSHPVDEVVVGRVGCRIRTGGVDLPVDAVVVTVPPWLLRAPGRSGGLVVRGVDPAAVHRASELPGGDAVSVLVTLRQPAPVSLSAFDARLGFVRSRTGSARILAVSKGPAASALRDAVHDPARLTAALCGALGWPGPGDPLDMRVADWGRRPWTRGAFSGPTVGHLAARNALLALQGGGLVVAGEATRSDGTAARMHGAVRSGVDAAHRVLSWLADAHPPDRDMPRAACRIGAAAGGFTLGGTI